MHFQANPSGAIPVEKAAVDPAHRSDGRTVDSVSLCTMRDYGREVVLLESGDRDALVNVLRRLLESLRRGMSSSEEPLVNVLCSYAERGWRVIVFPRRKHRPGAYFREESDRVLISPAAVDIGGLIITPLEKDFVRVDAPMIEEIFNEVSVSPSLIKDTLAYV
jgi:hypothetical protein